MNYKYVLTAVLIVAVFSGTASAWLSGYDHRMAITVNNGEASPLSHYQFNFTNDTNTLVAAGHIQASGADCRVTDASDNLIPFWNETVFNASGTKIWANATTLTVGDNTFYMYYGNAAASSVADIAGTFTFGDNFSVSPPADAWTRYANNPLLSSTSGDWDYGFHCHPYVIYHDATYWMYYYGAEDDPDVIPRKYGLATSSDGKNFTKNPNSPILEGTAATWDSHGVTDGAVLYHNSESWLYYAGQDATGHPVRIGLAKSSDHINFTKITNGLGGTSKVLEIGGTGEWDEPGVIPACIMYHNSEFWLYYWTGNNTIGVSLGLAKSPDGVDFTKIATGIGGTSQIMSKNDADVEAWEDRGPYRCSVFYYDGVFHMYYSGTTETPTYHKEIGYAHSTDGINWVRGTNNPVVPIGSASWEDDYLCSASFVFIDGNEANKGFLYWQGAYGARPTNRVGLSEQTIAHDWDGSGLVDNTKWTFSSTDAITIENGVLNVKAVSGGQHADVKTAHKPNFTEMDYDFVQEYDYKPIVGYTYYGITSIGLMDQNIYDGGANNILSWHYGGHTSGTQYIKLRTCTDSVYNDTSTISYVTNELYKFQTKKLAGSVVCKIWDTSHTETTPNIEDTLTAKDNYNFPYVTVFTRPSYIQPAAEIDNYRIRKLVSSEPTATLGAAETQGGGAYNITLPLGWSIIGWTDTTPRTAHYMGGLIGSNCTYVTTRNSTTGAYESHNMAVESINNFAIERGWGYYVKTIAETLWERDI